MNVGDTLWWVPAPRYGVAMEVSVTKVGRKWVTLDNGHRIDLETWTADGGNFMSPGTCWLSREAWERNTVLVQSWERLRRDASNLWRPPRDMTVERIAQVRDLLGLPKEET